MEKKSSENQRENTIVQKGVSHIDEEIEENNDIEYNGEIILDNQLSGEVISDIE